MHYFEVSVCFGWKGLFLTLTCVTEFYHEDSNREFKIQQWRQP